MTTVPPATREAVGPAERGYISPKMKLAVLLANGGRCCKCRKRLMQGDTEYDHVLSIWMGGLTEVGNIDCLCVSCHAAKTALDAASRAKVKRLQAKNMPDTDEKRKPSRAKKRIVSRSFDKTKRRRMSGVVEAR